MVRNDNPLLILTGAPGSGKTTVARLLTAQKNRAVHVESDCFFHFIKSGYVEPWKPESHGQNETIMRIVGDAAAGYAAAGYFTVIDGIISPDWFLESLSNALGASGFQVAYAVLRPSLPIAMPRSSNNSGETLPTSARLNTTRSTTACRRLKRRRPWLQLASGSGS